MHSFEHYTAVDFLPWRMPSYNKADEETGNCIDHQWAVSGN